MRLTKHHGLGNDFLVLTDPGGAAVVDPALARFACHRHRGVGADGFLHLTQGTDDGAGCTDVTMVLLNADGSRAEMSGNGIGCLAQAAVLAGLAARPRVTVATDAGRRVVELQPADGSRCDLATVEMGGAVVTDAVLGDLDLDGDFDGVGRAAFVSMGNPHLVLEASDPERLDDRRWVAALGRRAGSTAPGGLNVEVVAPGADGELRMDVWERGAGLTRACGTGACAAATAAHRWGLTDGHVVVRSVGGPTTVELHGSDVRMTAPITFVATVELAWP